MSYYVNLFSPATYDTFSLSNRSISGFRLHQKGIAERVRPGDKLICYLTKLSAWVGLLTVQSDFFIDDTPIYSDPDPFVVRFRVEPTVWLPKERGLPVHIPEIWNFLSFTSGLVPNSAQWTGKLRRSLNRLAEQDGAHIEEWLVQQNISSQPQIFPIDQDRWTRLVGHRVRKPTGARLVSIPETVTDDQENRPESVEIRESIDIQAQLGRIGTQMGMKIWIPRSDRQRVASASNGNQIDLIDILPLNYNETTIGTIERIDVLWLKGRSIVRAFEVEHTTSIYSGILRMADLMALQPNMEINLHIVAPEQRREKVFEEIRRPVFANMERGPLAKNCTYISYSSVRQIASLSHLNRMSSEIIDDYAEEVE